MTPRAITVLCLLALALAGPVRAAPDAPAGHVTGIGGVFIKARDPKIGRASCRERV